jgi:hypothetical protein
MSTDMPTLAERIAAAQRDVQPLALAVNTLESEKSSAIHREDFPAAERAQAELPAARQELAIAQALVDSLRTAEAEINRRRDEEARELQIAKMTADARANVDAEQARERDAIAEADRLIAQVREQVREARATIERAEAAERVAGVARQNVQHMMHLIDGRPESRVGRPNKVQDLLTRDPVLRAVAGPR